MKYCHNCKIYRPGESTFCTRCGSSFDVKYCRKLHPNAVTAEYCSVCGSSDLSAPHKRPRGRVGGLFTAAVAGLVISVATVGSIVHSVSDFDSVSAGVVLLIVICGAGLTVIWTWFKRR